MGKVFRNEAISYKHLPEFFQVDGIIIDEHANLASLLGTLKAFYSKMGFKKVKFKPDFFPYTEPTAPFAWHSHGARFSGPGGACDGRVLWYANAVESSRHHFCAGAQVADHPPLGSEHACSH